MDNVYTKIVAVLFFFLNSVCAFSNDRFQHIKVLLEEEQYEEAISQLERLPKEDTAPNPRVLNAVGWAYLKLNDYVKAEKYLKASFEQAKILGNKEAAVISSNNLGILSYLKNDLDQAEDYFDIGKERKSETALIYLDLIENKKKQIEFQDALLTGIKSRREQDFKAAIASYNNALVIQPNDVATLEFKGYALLRNDQYDLAIETLERAKSLDPTRKLVHLNLVKAYCLMQSDHGVKQSIKESLLGEKQFVDWYTADLEFRRMCRHSKYLSELINSHELNG
ncbi:tetratricopeptide repeat protein [Zooshikella marina]|uniref:tetratricopeptide repeat protein n=1 Tax=Zooshikella ganghwensis TaxID=202772 RepID=UPI001BB05FC0|nr:tetratricopeptide repeat protein [Zooshikella ganghwensis]MBU2705650.1 tetratricopeptide repeat protein [Zooshikella ganghwensis]